MLSVNIGQYSPIPFGFHTLIPDPNKAEPARLPGPRLALDGAAVRARQDPVPATGQVRQADLNQVRVDALIFIILELSHASQN